MSFRQLLGWTPPGGWGYRDLLSGTPPRRAIELSAGLAPAHASERGGWSDADRGR